LARIRAQIARQLPHPIHIVQSVEELNEVYELWQATYRDIYPNFKISRQDSYNEKAYILYTRNADNIVNSSARLAVDSPLGLPEDGYFPMEVNGYRKRGYKLMEFGRFIISGGNLSLLKAYYNAVYQIAAAEAIDIIPMAMKQKDVAFHRNLLGAYLLSGDIKIPHGGKDKMSCVSWELNKTKQRFFHWAGLPQIIEGAVS
jgi:hypothetical protein